MTIADNVLSDVQVNVELRHVRGAVVSGNTMWKGYASNVRVANCSQIVLSDNVFDRNPRYHYGDGATARLGLVFSDSDDCTIMGNHLHGVGDVPAAVWLRRCRRINVSGCSILDFGRCGILLENVSTSRVSDCLIHTSATDDPGTPLISTGGRSNMIVDNVLSGSAQIDDNTGVVRGNLDK